MSKDNRKRTAETALTNEDLRKKSKFDQQKDDKSRLTQDGDINKDAISTSSGKDESKTNEGPSDLKRKHQTRSSRLPTKPKTNMVSLEMYQHISNQLDASTKTVKGMQGKLKQMDILKNEVNSMKIQNDAEVLHHKKTAQQLKMAKDELKNLRNTYNENERLQILATTNKQIIADNEKKSNQRISEMEDCNLKIAALTQKNEEKEIALDSIIKEKDELSKKYTNLLNDMKIKQITHQRELEAIANNENHTEIEDATNSTDPKESDLKEMEIDDDNTATPTTPTATDSIQDTEFTANANDNNYNDDQTKGVILHNISVKVPNDEIPLNQTKPTYTATNGYGIAAGTWKYDKSHSLSQFGAGWKPGSESPAVQQLFTDEAVHVLELKTGGTITVHFGVSKQTTSTSLGLVDCLGNDIMARPDDFSNDQSKMWTLNGTKLNTFESCIIDTESTQQFLCEIVVRKLGSGLVAIGNHDGAVVELHKDGNKKLDLNTLGEENLIHISWGISKVVFKRHRKDMSLTGTGGKTHYAVSIAILNSETASNMEPNDTITNADNFRYWMGNTNYHIPEVAMITTTKTPSTSAFESYQMKIANEKQQRREQQQKQKTFKGKYHGYKKNNNKKYNKYNKNKRGGYQ